MIAIVGRDVNRLFTSREKKSARFRVFANDVDGSARGNSAHDFSPRLAAVARAKDVRAEIVEAESIDRGVRGQRIEMRRLHDRDFRPCS